MSVTCECCNHELSRKEIIQEIADKLDWEEGTEYGINESNRAYQSDQGTIYKNGLGKILEFIRENVSSDKSEKDSEGGSSD